MSNKFIGIGPEFGNECCICEGFADTITGTQSLSISHNFSPVGNNYTGCFTSSPSCLETGSQVSAECSGIERYFNVIRIEDSSYLPPNTCVTIGPLNDPLPPNQRDVLNCSGWQAYCMTQCEADCTAALSLDEAPPDGPCAPFTCCPCPETGDYSATASIVLAGGCSLSTSITIERDDGIAICSGENPASQGGVKCYEDTSAPYSGINRPYEKFGKYSGTLCAAGGGCSGTDINLSLCCCSTPGSMGVVRPGSSGECHMCNYQLTMNFLPISGTAGSSIEDYCYCPTGAYEFPMLPSTSHLSENTTFNAFEFVDGSCEPFYLEFEATGLYWNCDCCQAGDEEGVDNDVTITVTITV